jgi:hypothetical protein
MTVEDRRLTMFKTMETRWEGQLPGDPRQAWDGFTKYAVAYLWPIAYEPRVGGAERGLTPGGGTVTVWDPPRHFRTEAHRPDGWFNVLDYTLDGTYLRYVHTCAMEASEFDVQHDACIQHTNLYNHSLAEYLGHFAGREPHYLSFDDVPGSAAGVCARLGVPADAAVGDRVELGVIDYREGSFLGIRSDDALIRIYGRDVWGWPVGVAVHTFDGVGDEPAWRERLIEKAVA